MDFKPDAIMTQDLEWGGLSRDDEYVLCGGEIWNIVTRDTSVVDNLMGRNSAHLHLHTHFKGDEDFPCSPWRASLKICFDR